MASSEVEIANSALVKIGEERISSFDDPGKAARTCKRQYPLMRDRLLEDYNWTFAIARQSLAPDATPPDFGFEQRFLLPADCLRLIGLWTAGMDARQYTSTDIAHKVEGRYLLLDDTTAFIFFIKKVTNPIVFAPAFVECLALLLAVDICYDLTGGTAHETRLLQRLDKQIKRARLTQAIQGSPEVIEASEFLDAHQGFNSNARFRIGPVLS